MKLRGEFVVRQIMDSTVVIPVGQAALQLNGMILLNDVSKVIWESLEQDLDLETIVTAITDVFDVSADEARTDILDFIEKLRKMQLLDE